MAREGADVVLAEKDLTAIDHAIGAGRHSCGNIATYLRITLSSNLGNVIAMLAAGLLLPFLSMLPIQVLVQALCFDTVQLAFASGWFSENLITQALVMVLLRTGRRLFEDHAMGPVGWSAAGPAVIGLVLPPSPLGPVLGLASLVLDYYLLLTVVLARYTAGPVSARSRLFTWL